MAFKLKSPRNLVIAAIAFVVLWIIFWFYHFTNEPVNTVEVQIIQSTIGYEFSDITHEEEDTSLIHLNKDILKETLDDDHQSDEYENSNDLEYVDFNNPKSTKKTSNSFTFMKPSVNNVRKNRFTHKVFAPDTNVLLGHSSIPPRTEWRKIDDYYHDNKGTTASKEPYVLIHNAAASIVNIFQEVPSPFPLHIPKHLYTFTSERLPKDLHLRPSLGNGFIGTVVHSPHVYISGIYNGKKNLCHKAAVPSTASFNISGTEPSIKYTRQYVLDVSTGVYSEESVGESHTFVQKIYAHRTLANLLVTEVDYERKYGSKHITLKIDLNKWHSTQDFTFTGGEAKYPEVSYKEGVLNFPETNQSSSKKVHLIYDHIPSELKPPPKQSRCKWVFLTAYGFSQEEAERHYDEGMKLLVARDELYTEHVKGWSQLWRKGRIDVDGDDSLSSALYAGFYHLLSSIPLEFNNFVGVGATGLPFGNESFPFGDRIRADQELFVFPALLLMHADLSKHILSSRNFTVGGAYENARKGGSNGLAFPYEGASQGNDLDYKKTGFTSPHVTASVLFAIKQYLDATNDASFVNHNLSQLVFDAADFLHSRLSSKDDLFHVLNQVSIDEGLGVVQDSISGNALIRRALTLPYELDSKQTRFLLWREDAAKIFLPKLKNNLHASHSEYKKDDRVWEADVLMLNFPLMTNLSNGTLLQDLTYYEKVLNPQTSPMSEALLAISWLDVGQKLRADLYLKHLLPNFAPPFKTWTSHYRNGIILPNHLPAIGGLLQSLSFGYGGFRLRDDRMDIDPKIPLNVTSLHFVGVDYLGNSVNVVISQQETSVMVTKMAKPETHVLHLHQYENDSRRKMDLNVQITVRRSRVAIVREALLQTKS